MSETVNQQINNANISVFNPVNKIAGISNYAAQENARAFFTINDAKKVAQQFSTQVINKAVSSIGSRTGNYVLQERVQSGIDVVTKIASIGFAFTNPIVGAFTLVSEGIGLALDIAQRNREVMWQNRAASELARRAGYLSDQNR